MSLPEGYFKKWKPTQDVICGSMSGAYYSIPKISSELRKGLTMVEPTLRIGFLTPEYPTESYSGGIGSYVRQMAHSLVGLGQSVVVLLCVSSNEGLTWDGPVAIHRVRTSRFAEHLPAPLGKRSGLISARQLARLAAKLRLDVLEAPEFSGLTAFLSLMAPPDLRVVLRLHTGSTICRSLDKHWTSSVKQLINNKLQDWLEARAINTANTVTAISQATVDLTRQMLGIHRNDFHVTPNPVNDLFFSGINEAQVTKEPLVFFAGRLQWLKGPDVLIRALPLLLDRHPNVRLCLAGGDTNTAPGGNSMLTYLSGLIPEKARARVEFTGVLGPEQLLQRYHQATVCVFPSRWEGFGLVAAEAMAAGRPVVVSDAPGFLEVVRNGVTGLLTKREDPEDLAMTIGMLLGDSNRRKALGAAAGSVALSQFRGSIVAKEMMTIYRSPAPSATIPRRSEAILVKQR